MELEMKDVEKVEPEELVAGTNGSEQNGSSEIDRRPSEEQRPEPARVILKMIRKQEDPTSYDIVDSSDIQPRYRVEEKQETTPLNVVAKVEEVEEVKQEPEVKEEEKEVAEVSDDNKQGDKEMEGQEEEEEEEEEEPKDVEMKDSEEKEEKDLTQDSNNQNGSETPPSSLGRNRRVRKRNAFFNDFHCTDLIKGARSNKEDYDTFTSGIRTSNRRSTTDSRGQSEETTEVFIETKYCRKCSTKTPRDFDGGCQACLYKKIVESSKRQKPASQKNRSGGNSRQQQHNHQDSSESNHQTPVAPSNNNKRKTARQGGSKSSNNNTNSNSTRTTSNLNAATQNTTTTSTTIINNDDQANIKINSKANNNIVDTTPISPPNELINQDSSSSSGSSCNSSNNSTSNSNNSGTSNESNKLPKLDLWSPDEVADYIMSKGFTNEAELFKTQSVDGIALLLMQRTDFTYGLKIKLGPALKIYDQVCKLKREYFQTIKI